MRYLLFILVLSIFIGGFLFINKTYAFGLLRPFGGRVVSTMMPAVTCSGTGAITITPVGKSPSTSYVTMGKRIPKIGSWILGLYSPNAPICATNSTPPTPYNAKAVTIYGISGKLGF